MLSTLLAVLDPGDEVVIFEPYYENYGPDSIISARCRHFVRLREPDWTFDEQELARGVQRSHARHHHQHAEQPDRQGLSRGPSCSSSRDSASSGTCSRFTDEIYEHIIYDGHNTCRSRRSTAWRAHRHHQRSLEDVQRHGMARRAGRLRRSIWPGPSARCTTSSR
jgi:hypothetical protein